MKKSTLSQNSSLFIKELIIYERFGLREWQNRISHEKLLQIDGVNLSRDLKFDGFDGKHVYFHVYQRISADISGYQRISANISEYQRISAIFACFCDLSRKMCLNLVVDCLNESSGDLHGVEIWPFYCLSLAGGGRDPPPNDIIL